MKPPQDTIFPAVVLHEVSHQQGQYLDQWSRVQVTTLAESTSSDCGYDIAHRISSNILTVLNLFSGSNGTYRISEICHIIDTENIAENPEVYAIHSDFSIVWTE
jgi:hypothetical protein